MSENLIIFNARIVTPIGFSARKGEEMSQLQVIENGTVEVTKGIITPPMVKAPILKKIPNASR